MRNQARPGEGGEAAPARRGYRSPSSAPWPRSRSGGGTWVTGAEASGTAPYPGHPARGAGRAPCVGWDHPNDTAGHAPIRWRAGSIIG